MNRLAVLFGVPLFLPLIASAQLADGACKVYTGTLGASTQIGMSLYSKDKTVQGAYFYRKYLKDIPLKGTETGSNDVELQETSPAGVVQGTFRLKTEKGDTVYGTWTSADKAKNFPVKTRVEHNCAPPGTLEYGVAGATDDAMVERNAQAFYNAVTQGNREEAAKNVSYPCTFFRDGKRVSVRNTTGFLKNYDAIFTEAFVAKIAEGVPHHMFANSQGMMIADGAVWFDENGKARNLNNFPAS